MFAVMTRAKQRMQVCALTAAMVICTSGLALAQDWRLNDSDRDNYNRDRDYDSDRGTLRYARDFGFNDGRTVGREDQYKRKPFNPYPRGKYAHEDHGYRRQFGDKYGYQAEYARAYHEGYERAFR